MRFEDVSYAAGADPAQFNRIRDNLPDYVRRELIQDPRILKLTDFMPRGVFPGGE